MSDNITISLVDQWHYRSQSTKIIASNLFKRQKFDAAQQKQRELGDVVYTEVKYVQKISVFNHMWSIKIVVLSFWHNYTPKNCSYLYEIFVPAARIYSKAAQ